MLRSLSYLLLSPAFSVPVSVLLSLQLFFQFSQKAPIRSLSNHLLWARLDHPDLIHANRVEAPRVLGIVLSPLVVVHFLNHLQGVVVVQRGIPLLYEQSRGSLRLESADAIRLQDCAQRPFSGHRMLPNKFPVGNDHTTEILRPGPVHHRVDDHVPDFLRPELLWFQWKGH